MTTNKYTKLFTISTYILLVALTTFFLINVEDFEGPLQTIIILITIIGPLLGLGLAKLSLAFDKWRYSKDAFNIGIFLSKYIAPLTLIVFLVLAIFAVLNGNIFYIAYAAPIAILGPFIGVIYDEVG